MYMSARDVNISIDTADVMEKVYMLRNIKNGGAKAITRGLNKAVARMKTESKTPIRDTYTIKKITDVTGSIKVRKATYSNMSADINSKGRPIPLTNFQYTPNPSPGVKGTPTAFAKVRKDKGGGYTGGFVTSVKWSSKSGASGNHKGIFKRVGKSRYPIKQLYGPGATEMLNNEKTKQVITETAVTEFDKEFNRQVAYLFKGGK